jgi:O-antigen/teichoic acid export membrane protein
MDKKSFAHDFGFLAASRFVTYACIFASGILLTRGLSKAEYGTISQVSLLGSSVSLVLGTWIAKSLYYYLPKSSNRGAIGFQTTLVTSLLGVIGGIVLWQLGPWLGHRFENDQLTAVSPVLGFYMATLTPYACLQPYMVSVGRARLLAACLTVSSLLMLGGIAYGVWQRLSVDWLVLIMGATYFLVLLFLIRENLALALREKSFFAMETLKQQFVYSGPLFLSSTTIVVARYLDRFIVASLFSVEEFAIYYRGAIELPFVVIVVYSLMSMLLPRFVEMYKENRLADLTRTWHASIEKTCLLLFPAMVGFAVLSPDVILFLYGERYANSAPVFQVYVLTLFFQATGYDSVAQAVNRTKYVFQGALLGVVINFCVGISLIRLVGPVGAAFGMVISQACLMLYYHRRLAPVLGRSMLSVYPWKTVMKVLGIAGVSGLLCYLGVRLLLPEPGGARIAVYGVTYTVLYFAVVFGFKLLTREDLALFGIRLPTGRS